MRQIGRPRAGKPGPSLRRLLEARTDTKQARRPLGRARIRRVHAVLHAYLNSAVRRGLIPRNPASNVELERGRPTRALVWTAPRVARWHQTGRRPSPVMVWTPDQAGAFLDAIVTDRLYPLFHLVAYRGLRRSEVLGLPWTDLDLDHAILTIRETLVDPDDLDADYVDFDDPKTAASERVLSLDTHTVAILRAWRRQQHAERLAHGPAWHDSGRVFTKENGEPLNPDTLSQLFDRLIARTHRPTGACTATTARGQQCQRLAVVALHAQPRCGLAAHGGQDPAAVPLRQPGLPPIRFHDLRHTAASLTYRATRDLKLVSALLGHSSIKITADIYTNIFADVDLAAAEAVAQLVPRSVLHPGAHQVHTMPEIGPAGL
jgi:integrase